MLRSVKRMYDLAIRAPDGTLGGVHDIYFEDESWMIRYLVADTGSWLPGRRVLIAPECANPADTSRMELPVCLTRDQVRNAPDIDTDKPVSRQKELELRSYYDWPIYWGLPDAPEPIISPGFPGYPIAPESSAEGHKVDHDKTRTNPHLRSARELSGYHIEALDGNVGHLDDFLIEDRTWRVRYLIVEIGGWLVGGRKVAVAVEWVGQIDWADSRLYVELNRPDIESSPPYGPVVADLADFADLVDEHYAGVIASCDSGSRSCQPVVGP